MQQSLKEHLAEHAFMYNSPLHGVTHWRHVERMGFYLAEHSGADTEIVSLFAWLHDCMRMNEGEDPEHGPRAAEYAKTIRSQFIDLDQERFDKLVFACEHHTQGGQTDDPTIGTCWDADRLDLGRVGVVPSTDYLMTSEARRIAKEADWRLLHSLRSKGEEFIISEQGGVGYTETLLFKVGDIVDEQTEGLVCSGNVQLNMTGGVNGELLSRGGVNMQRQLHDWLNRQEKKYVEPGFVMRIGPEPFHFKSIVYTVAVSGWYESTVPLTAQALEAALKLLEEDRCSTVSIPALATGFGNLPIRDFGVVLQICLNSRQWKFEEIRIVLKSEADMNAVKSGYEGK